MVLDRDRKLYDMLVQELFSSTCPAPHEYYNMHGEEEGEGATSHRERGSVHLENEVHAAAATITNTTTPKTITPCAGDDDDDGDQKATRTDEHDFVIDGDGDGNDEKNENENDIADTANMNNNSASPPSTPIESTTDDITISATSATISTPKPTTNTNTSTPSMTTTPLTPGLLSARMQLEWIRGENGGEDAVLGPNHHPSCGSPSSFSSRISPMCAMNTPRTRTYHQQPMTKKSGGGDVVVDEVKEDGPPRTISEDIAADLADIEQSRDVDGMLLSHRFKES